MRRGRIGKFLQRHGEELPDGELAAAVVDAGKIGERLAKPHERVGKAAGGSK